MSGNQTTDGSTDELQRLVRAFAEAAYNAPGEKPIPMATDDAVDVIRSQLTENTGRHLLDSGSAYGRHWEENQENPPWERPAWDVGNGYVTHNVYHWMERAFGRDRPAVALEAALYAFGHTDSQEREPWLSSSEAFRDLLFDNALTEFDLREWGVPDGFITDVLAVQNDIQGTEAGFTFNTYNGECHSLSQVLQGVVLGGPYAGYGFVQVHQGADVRGGYTGPRAYTSAMGGWLPHELEFRCQRCEWVDYESCLYGSDELRYQRSIDPFELQDEGLIEEGDDDHPALNAAHDDDHIDGAVFHTCDDDHIGYCVFR
jgi:hypothetical protein